MKKKAAISIIIILIVIIIGVDIFFSLKSNKPNVVLPSETCNVYSDCVPAQCCHPTSCINKNYKTVCNLACTQGCSGPLDCGGSCGCAEGKCYVISGETHTN